VTKYHNIVRKKYGVPNLKSDFDLTVKAIRCAEFLLKKGISPVGHPCKPKEGENIYSANIGPIQPKQIPDIMINAMNYW